MQVKFFQHVQTRNDIEPLEEAMNEWLSSHPNIEIVHRDFRIESGVNQLGGSYAQHTVVLYYRKYAVSTYPNVE